MDFEAMPILKLEVTRMSHAISTHLGAAGSELGERIDAEIQQQIKEFPWENVIKKTIIDSVSREVEDYFKYGPGGLAVKAAIHKAFESLKPDKTR